MRNKTFSIINIAGLAIGLSCFLLITLYVMDELSFDRYFNNSNRIYRINSDIRFGGTDLHLPVTSDMMGQLLKKDYPQVENYTRIYTFNGDKLFKKGNEYIDETKVCHADSTFFDVFTLPSIEGNTKTALNDPNTVVITQSIAKKYFGITDVLNKTIEVKKDDKTELYKITAVIRDIPENSHFHFDFIFSMKNLDYKWGLITAHNFFTYLLLRKGTDYKAFEKNLTKYLEKYVGPYARENMHISSLEDFEKAGNKLVYTLMPLTQIHLYSDRTFELSSGGNIQYIYIFSAIALFILLIACINFMNLTTARSANRAKEVGIRKVMGTGRKNLIVQFLLESMILVLLSLLIAIVIVYAVLPLFNNLANKQMTLQSLFTPYVLPLLVSLPVVVGLLAGGYPAFFLSSFRPVEVLKGKIKSGSKSGNLRSTLVVFQFATSVILIIATIVVYLQLNFIQTKNVGFDKNQVLIINGTSALGNQITAFKNQVLQLPGVISGTVSGFLPVTSSSRNDHSYSKDAVMNSQNGIDMQTWTIDYDYIKTIGLDIVRGRNFSREFGSDSEAVILNESAARFLGDKDPVGQKIYSLNDNLSKTQASFNIIGVVRNFNFESLRKDVGPLCFRLGNNPHLASFKINSGNANSLIAQIQTKWKAMASGMPFSYRFLDESFNEMYNAEQRVGKIALIFSVLAIFIACLGLFGLATYMTEQRTKEIGIRKVLGASVPGIVRMISKDFIKLVLLSALVAFPIAWYAMNKWLQDFAYRINMSWWIFLTAGLLTICIALITISFQSIKAAIVNPVKSLRTE